MSFAYDKVNNIAFEDDDVTCMAFLNEVTMVVAMWDGKLRKINVETNEIIAEVDCPKHVPMMEIHDGVIVMAGNQCGAWEASTLTKLVTFCENCKSIKIIPDKRRVLTGEYYSVVRMWDMDTGEFITTVNEADNEHVYMVQCIEYDDKLNEVWFGVGSDVKCVNLLSGKLIKTFSQHTGVVHVVCKVGHDEFISGDGDGSIFKWKSDMSLLGKSNQKQAIRASFVSGPRAFFSTYARSLLMLDASDTDCVEIATDSYCLGPYVCVSPSGAKFAYGKSHYEINICKIKTQ